jgi:hypothetical protein
MDLKQLKTSDTTNTETIAFRISPREKEALIDACYRHQLGLGKVMRMLVNEFLENLEEIEDNANIQRN